MQQQQQRQHDEEQSSVCAVLQWYECWSYICEIHVMGLGTGPAAPCLIYDSLRPAAIMLTGRLHTVSADLRDGILHLRHMHGVLKMFRLWCASCWAVLYSTHCCGSAIPATNLF